MLLPMQKEDIEKLFEHGPPKEIFPYVREFTQSLGVETEPFYMAITPGADDAIKECVVNVDRKVRLEGGEVVYGWKIWELYGLMIEAEFHAVWRSPDGKLYDITPNERPFERILFLLDSRTIYEGQQINNIRKALNDDPAVQGYIAANNKMHEILNRGDRANQHGKIRLTDEEASEYHNAEIQAAELGLTMVTRTPGRNDLCRCGAGKKAKKCC